MHWQSVSKLDLTASPTVSLWIAIADADEEPSKPHQVCPCQLLSHSIAQPLDLIESTWPSANLGSGNESGGPIVQVGSSDISDAMTAGSSGITRDARVKRSGGRVGLSFASPLVAGEGVGVTVRVTKVVTTTTVMLFVDEVDADVDVGVGDDNDEEEVLDVVGDDVVRDVGRTEELPARSVDLNDADVGENGGDTLKKVPSAGERAVESEEVGLLL